MYLALDVELGARTTTVPHCPTPVSVVSRLVPSAVVKLGGEVLTLWDPAGLTDSSL